MQNTMKPINSPDGLFHDGNPYTGELGTVVTSEWLNNVQSAAQSSQDELLTVIRDSGQSADPARKDQLLQALRKLAWGGNSKPNTLAGYGITDALPLSGGKMNGRVDFQPNSRFLAEGGAEGGQFMLQAPQVNSQLGDVIVDISSNAFRVFDNGKTQSRGFYVDLTQCEHGPTTNLLTMSGAPGMVAHFAMPYTPPGWLKCDGSLVSRGTYPGLFAVIGTTYGAGDGSTTFNLPDLRGEFIRGWDYGGGVDDGRAFGSWQKGTLTISDPSLDSVGVASLIHANNNTPIGYVDLGADKTKKEYYEMRRAQMEGYGIVYDVDSNGWAGGYGSTRPRNVALLACIKY
ncbi:MULTISPECIES: phage tail protein [Chromobacterium]|uniref:phage tail protein n=1 Tax=Chromobacterium TaxID=535 RepID=UPI001E535930|nr:MULTISPECIES: phage tail protein [Chromobacterium]WON82301.1 tail fiber protein [Chromobacterium haemolyticum]